MIYSVRLRELNSGEPRLAICDSLHGFNDDLALVNGTRQSLLTRMTLGVRPRSTLQYPDKSEAFVRAHEA